MLFPWEILLHQILMVVVLVLSAIISIVINKADLSGKKKYTLFKFIRSFTLFFILPTTLFLMAANVWGIAQLDFITVEKAAYRGIIAITGLITMLVAAFSIVPQTNEGMKEVRRKSITASKYQKIFQKLRANFITIMLTIALGFWIMYLFR